MWKLKNGETVVDRPLSHIHKGVLQFLPATLAKIETKGRNFLVEEIDFGQTIGKTICVETGPSDQILFAQRSGRCGHTRFVLNRAAEPCSSIVVILKARDYDEYVLITAYIGQLAEPEPWDRKATEKSKAFWNSHALIWGSEPIIPGTVTALLPYGWQ